MSITTEKNSNRVFIGVDLGKHGAIHVTKDNGFRYSLGMPLDEEGQLDIFGMKIYLETIVKNEKDSPVYVIFEKLTPLHLASKSSNWSLAFQSGAVEALCIMLKVPYIRVLPKVWQKEMLADIAPLRKEKGETDTKARALLAVKKLFPDLKLTDPKSKRATKPHDGIVDAILLAEYGRKNTE